MAATITAQAATCARCGATPGQVCRNVATGAELAEAHAERREVVRLARELVTAQRAARRAARADQRARQGETYESAAVGAMLRRMLGAMVRRAGEGDLDALAELHQLAGQLDGATLAAGQGAHRSGYSWTEIAQPLGISRQAARQRFAAAEAS